jgi:solute carrier family 25 phosphate transporter 23/24/25/41
MLKQMPIPEYQGLNTIQSIRHMWHREGFYGFMKGNGVNVVRIAPFSALEFYFYELYKSLLMTSDKESNLIKLLCGGLTGMTASTLTYPLDLIRTHLSLNV